MYLTGEALALTVAPHNSSTWNASKGYSSNWTIDSYHHHLQVNEAGELARVVIVGFLFAIFILTAIVGNFLVITAIVTERNLRKAGNNFVISLAVADALVACLVMTFAAVNDLTYRWQFGAIFCDIWQSSDVMCCTASILNICAVSLDRYIHIKDPMRYRNLVTQRRSLVAVALIWVMSALLSFLPIHLGWHHLGRVAPNETVTLTETDDAVMTLTIVAEGLTSFTPAFDPVIVFGGGSVVEEEVCQLELSPWYACVSSTVSFYIPCIVLVVIYARLYRISQRHRKFMKSVSVNKGLHTPASSNLHISMAGAELEEEEEEEAVFDIPSTPGVNGPVSPGSGSGGGDDQSEQQNSSCYNFQPVPVVTISTRSSMLEGLNQENNSRTWSVGSSSVGVDGSTGKRRILSELRRTIVPSRSFSDFNGNGATPPHTMQGPSVVSCPPPPRQSPLLLDALGQESSSRHWSMGSSYLGADSSTGKRRIFCSSLKRTIAASRSLSDFNPSGPGHAIPAENRPASVVSSYPPRQSDYKTAITVGCIIGIFLFCWGPFFIINIIGSVFEGSISPVVFTCFSWLGYLNSCANPVIYGVTNVEFRRAFLRILMGSCFAWRHRRRWRGRREFSGGGSQNPGPTGGGRGRRAIRSDNNNYREVRTYEPQPPPSANGLR